jgi:type IX secretion system PorP/SprF family membrane protein
MKKIIILFIFLIAVSTSYAQQAVLYTQFMLNDYGLNPAVAGSGKDWSIMTGRRTQWRGFAYAPETTFASVVKDFGKKGIRRYWHGIGAYVEQDKFGAFTTKVLYASYAIHLKLSGKHYLSFGLAAGTKTTALSNSYYDANDPAISSRTVKVLLWPDLIPGIYLYSSKFTAGVSIRNIYKSTLQQGSKKIGSPTKLPQVVYITFSRKIRSSNYDFVNVPAIQIQSTYTSLPLIQFNFMTYYRKVVGLGLTYRMHDAIAAMLQVRLWQHVVIGFSYDYTISKLRSSDSNSTEIMFGFTPNGSEDYEGRANVAKCPKFDF